jgi:hypothetical protein
MGWKKPWILWKAGEEMWTKAGRDLLRQVSSLIFGVGNFAEDYAVNGTERLCLPTESPVWRTGSIVGGEQHPGNIRG